MKTHTVWRLEDEEGRGVYYAEWPQDGYFTQAIRMSGGFHGREIDKCWDRHVLPDNDAGLDWRTLLGAYCHVFGFADLTQYRRWVFCRAWRRNLARLGVRLNRYEVQPDGFRRGTHQVVFRREFAKLVESHSPDEF